MPLPGWQPSDSPRLSGLTGKGPACALPLFPLSDAFLQPHWPFAVLTSRTACSALQPVHLLLPVRGSPFRQHQRCRLSSSRHVLTEDLPGCAVGDRNPSPPREAPSLLPPCSERPPHLVPPDVPGVPLASWLPGGLPLSLPLERQPHEGGCFYVLRVHLCRSQSGAWKTRRAR